MKLFAGTSAFIALIVVLFLALIETPEITLFLCPVGLILVWLNGFAASRFNVKISVETKATPDAPPPAPRQPRPVRRSEFQ